jgi:hypothetical protein
VPAHDVRSRRDHVCVYPPLFLSSGPSYSELYAEGCFSQLPLMSRDRFRDAARQRELDVPLDFRDVLRPLDRAEILCPVGFLQTNYTPELTWLHPDPSFLVWREERHYEPWERYRWYLPSDTEHRFGEIEERYSAWQLLYLADALSTLGRAAEGGHSLDAEWRPLVKLLTALQTRFWPYRRGSTTLVYEPESEERIDPLARSVSEFDPHRVLRRFELSLDALAEVHLQLGEAANRLNPFPRWYRLTEAAPRKVTDEMRGHALRSRDLYDACYLVRLLYHLAKGQWLPQADELDPVDVDWRRQHLPRPSHLAGHHADLKDRLIEQGLYPHLIYFFVEGTSEEIVLKHLLELLGFEVPASGMTVRSMKGIDKAERHSVLFEAAMQFAARTVLIADREGEIERVLRSLRAEGVFTNEGDVLLWSRDGRASDFEEANFSDVEILRAIRRRGRKKNPRAKLALPVAVLRAERERLTTPGQRPPALAKTALKLAAKPEHGLIDVTKRELAYELAEQLAKEIREADDLEAVGRNRPLLERLRRWLIAARR